MSEEISSNVVQPAPNSDEAMQRSIADARKATKEANAYVTDNGPNNPYHSNFVRISKATTEYMGRSNSDNPNLRVTTHRYGDGMHVKGSYKKVAKDGTTREYRAVFSNEQPARGEFPRTRVTVRDSGGKVIRERLSNKPFLAKQATAAIGNIITKRALDTIAGAGANKKAA